MSQIYANYLDRLVKCLPMDDTHFITKLSAQQLLPGNTESKIKTISTQAEKASYFLSHVIKPALDIDDMLGFNKLLLVMQECEYDYVQRLSGKISDDIKLDNTGTSTSVVSKNGQKFHSESTDERIYEPLPKYRKMTDFHDTCLRLGEKLKKRYTHVYCDPLNSDGHLSSSCSDYIKVDAFISSKINLKTCKVNVKREDFDLPQYIANEVLSEKSPKQILIEGVPGIGKTFLCKYIAYQWAKNEILCDYQLLFLLFLREKEVQNIANEAEFFAYFCNTDESKILSSKYDTCTEIRSLILLDGYDEIHENKRQDNFLCKIISKREFPHCDVIITSRSSACEKLHCNLEVIVKINGFNETSKLEMIKNCVKDTAQVTTLKNYLAIHETHSTVQSFLAAVYVSKLPYEDQLQHLEKYFLDINFRYMWIMYSGYTRAGKPAFLKYLSGNDDYCKGLKLSSRITSNCNKRLKVFQCLFEAKKADWYRHIIKLFNDKVLKFRHISLTSEDLEMIYVFLKHSNINEWNSFNFDMCNMGDVGFAVLHEMLVNGIDKNIVVNEIILSGNNLSLMSAGNVCNVIEACSISQVVLKDSNIYDEESIKMLLHKTSIRNLDLSENNICDSKMKVLCSVLSLGETNLEILHLNKIGITDDVSESLRKLLTGNTKLKRLWMCENSLSIKSAQGIASGLVKNRTLEWLFINNNNFDDDAISFIANSLAHNEKLEILDISFNPISVEKINQLIESCSKNNSLHSLKVSCNHPEKLINIEGLKVHFP